MQLPQHREAGLILLGLLCTQHSNLIALDGSSRGLPIFIQKKSVNHTLNIDDTVGV